MIVTRRSCAMMGVKVMRHEKNLHGILKVSIRNLRMSEHDLSQM